MHDRDSHSIVCGRRKLDYPTLMERAARAASALHAHGVRQNDRVALLLRNDLCFFEASLALSMLGAYAVPINWHFKTEEIGYILTDCGAKLVLAHADLVPAALPGGCKVIAVATPEEISAAYAVPKAQCHIPATLPDWDRLLDEYSPWPDPTTVMRSSIVYTSGTTGRPKGVCREPLSQEQLGRLMQIVAQTYGITHESDCRTVILGPMYHSAPNGYAMLAAQVRAHIVLMPRFDAEMLLQIIERERITHLLMVPTMFVRLLKLPQQVRNQYDLSSLVWVTHGAAPCAASVKQQMIEWWGPIIYEFYGSTETGITTVASSSDFLDRPGTVGRPVDGVELRIYDDAGTALSAGQAGEVYVGFGNYSNFTYHGQQQKREEIERDSLISLGDIGYLDEDNYLYLCDRKRDMVISGGVNIYPAEIEAALIEMPGVRDCAVFGIPHEEFGESLCAYVETVEDITMTSVQVREYLKDRIAHYKIPTRIEFQSPLPREDSGKIFKRKLRDPYWQDRQQRI